MCIYSVINIHFLDACNFMCKHCFVKKENRKLSYEEIIKVVDKIKNYFDDKNVKEGRINLAGGEPLLSSDIDKIIEYIYSKNIKVSLITNGFYLTKEFIERHKNHLFSIGISVDSLKKETNIIIGRCQQDNRVLKKNKLIEICKYIKKANIKLKINTCISKLNYKENFVEFLQQIKPDRYKVLQMVCDNYDTKNIINKITDDQFNEFLNRHKNYIDVIEKDYEMKNSYVIIDSKGNVSTNNLHKSSYTIFDNDLNNILYKLDINENDYLRRYKNNK